MTFTAANAIQSVLDVTLTFTSGDTTSVLLALPEWTPGAYEVAN